MFHICSSFCRFCPGTSVHADEVTDNCSQFGNENNQYVDSFLTIQQVNHPKIELFAHSFHQRHLTIKDETWIIKKVEFLRNSIVTY